MGGGRAAKPTGEDNAEEEGGGVGREDEEAETRGGRGRGEEEGERAVAAARAEGSVIDSIYMRGGSPYA